MRCRAAPGTAPLRGSFARQDEHTEKARHTEQISNKNMVDKRHGKG